MSPWHALSLAILSLSWILWAWPFVFLAPHGQKRASTTRLGPTRAGLLLEVVGIGLAFALHLPAGTAPGAARMAAAMVLGPASAVLAFAAVRHLGRQFRIHAGLYEDHELVRTGPYALVRHPIYASLLLILLATLCLQTPWQWAPLPLALFIVGTEIRVRTEDRLLASRFGGEFEDYRKRVRAYVPFVR